MIVGFLGCLIHFWKLLASSATPPVFSNTASIKAWQIRNINSNDDIWLDTQIPSTVVNALIENGVFLKDYPDTTTTLEEKPYYKDALSTIPDINVTGPDFYTYYWRPCSEHNQPSLLKKETGLRFHFLRFHGVGFKSKLFHVNNDKENLSLIGETLGMWKRNTFDITPYILENRLDLTEFQLLIFPPDHVGIPSSFCPFRNDTALSCGQGGDHELAKDSGAIQFSAGWDWAQGIPDRVTGIFDKVDLVSTGAVMVSESVVETISISGALKLEPGMSDDERVDATLRVETRLTNVEKNKSTKGLLTVRMTSREEKVVQLVLKRKVELKGGESKLVEFKKVELSKARLWWIWQLGSPSLYDAEFVFEEEVGNSTKSRNYRHIISDMERINVGIRTTSSYIDEVTGGRAFSLNGVPVFIQGGNWIATDMMLRFSDDQHRYDSEVLFHKLAGLNLLRVWGGGLTERPKFYDACDRLGLFVFQEFWMSGDNNGRWGGKYSYPLNYESYLEQARDVVKMIRTHPSLLFYGGGNELFPQSMSPPPYISRGLKSLMEELDKTRLFILSSMDGGMDGSDMLHHDPRFALAPKDGPYGYLPCNSYYSDPNPGLTNGSSITISFQPEIGASSSPRFRSLKRMGLADNPASFPSKCDGEIPDLFSYHKYEGYCMGSSGYDAVYAYGSPFNLSEWATRAQLAAHQQYQSLFEGFTSKMFIPKEMGGKSAIIMWKTQSPWPSLRGFLYDWFLDSTGTFDGVRAGTGGPSAFLHPQLDIGSLKPQLINRGRWPLRSDGSLTVTFFTKEGEEVGSKLEEKVGTVKPMSVFRGGASATWPEGYENETLFLRVCWKSATPEDAVVSPTWYWLRDPNLGPYYDFKDLGVWRDEGPFPQIEATINRIIIDIDSDSKQGEREYDDMWRGIVTISVSLDSKAVAFKPSLTLFYESLNNDERHHDDRVLPSFFQDVPTVILPGEQTTISISIPQSATNSVKRRKIQSLKIELWAGQDTAVTVQENAILDAHSTPLQLTKFK